MMPTADGRLVLAESGVGKVRSWRRGDTRPMRAIISADPQRRAVGRIRPGTELKHEVPALRKLGMADPHFE